MPYLPPINLSILDFKYSELNGKGIVDGTINLSILDFKWQSNRNHTKVE